MGSEMCIRDSTETVAKDIRNAAQNIRENKLDRKCSKEKCSACYLNYLCLSKEEKKTYVEWINRRTYGKFITDSKKKNAGIS